MEAGTDPPDNPRRQARWFNDFSRDLTREIFRDNSHLFKTVPFDAWDESLRKLGHKSWFTSKRFCPEDPLLSIESTAHLWYRVYDSKPPGDPEGLKTRKLHLRFTTKQRQVMKKIFGVARFMYNKAVEWIEAERIKHAEEPEWRPSFYGVRDILNPPSRWPDKPWIKGCPSHIRANAINDAVKAYDSASRLLEEGKIDHFKLHFKSKKAQSNSIVIDRDSYRRKGVIYPRTLGKETIQSREDLPKKLEHDTRLQMTRTGKFYLCRLIPLENRSKITKTFPRVVAIDPGNRKMITCFDNSGIVTQFGVHDMDKIYKILIRYDNLISEASKAKSKHKWRMRRFGRQLLERVRFKIKELHCKAAKWLCDNYDIILLPVFQTQQMVSTLNSKVARAMMTYSHYAFQQRVIFKAREYGCKVILVTEEWTSQICHRCGEIHNPGSSETYKCSDCGLIIDRDINAAICIMLLYLTKFEF